MVIFHTQTPTKICIANGIITISTDFEFMGKTRIEMILKNNKSKIENPSQLILRNSL
jgi:DNA-binding LacI/PurR family transcriptional regulator